MDRLMPIHERSELESLRKENKRLNEENRSLRGGSRNRSFQSMLPRKTFEEHELIQRKVQRRCQEHLDLFFQERTPWYARLWSSVCKGAKYVAALIA